MKFKLSFRIIALVLTLALLVQMAPMRLFASAAETTDASTPNSAAVDIEENLPVSIVGEVDSLREEDTKHFRMSDGTFMAVSYGMPVHYQDENGAWQDIDNSLTVSADRSVLGTQNANVSTTFSANLGNGNVFSTSFGNTSVSMMILDTTQANTIISTNQQISTSTQPLTPIGQSTLTYDRTAIADTTVVTPSVLQPEGEDSGYWSFEEIIPENLQSSVLYENVYPGVDLLYTAYSFNIKEQIIVKQPQNSYRYDFALELNGVEAVLNEDGSVSLIDAANKILYSIPAPYMQDSNGVVSYDVSYVLTPVSGGVILTVIADADWMNDEDRAYPVAIDPTLEVENGTSEDHIYTSYVASGTPDSSYRGSTIYFGYTTYNDVGEYRTFLHFNNLPSVPVGSIITNAKFGLYMHTYSKVNCPQLASCVYEVTEDKSGSQTYYNWINGLTWSNMPIFNDDNMIDYAVLKASGLNKYYHWDITELAKKWYLEGTANRTVMLKTVDGACTSSSYAQPAFYGTASASNPPVLIVQYRSGVGIEPYYTYNTLGAGHAGTAYIADNSGQLKVAKELVTYASTVNPFSLSLNYSSDYFQINNTAAHYPMTNRGFTMNAGAGVTLNYAQSLSAVTISGTVYLKYTDGDGTDHYFAKDSDRDANYYYDEDGLGLKLILNSNGTYTMSDDQDNKWTFSGGFLTNYTDNNGNQIIVDISSGKITRIRQQNNGQSAITVATLAYDSSNYLTSVTDAAGNVVSFSYSGGKLTGINYKDSAATSASPLATYGYSGYRLTSMTEAESSYSLQFTYYSYGKLSKYKEMAGTSPGAEVDIEYSGLTKISYIDYGQNRVRDTVGTEANDDVTAHYLFDYEGHTVNSSVTDWEGEIWGASTAAYSGSGTTDKTNNRTLRSASIGVMGMQYLYDSGLEAPNASYPWSYGSGASRSTNARRTGSYGIQVTQSLGTSTPVVSRNAGYLGAGYWYTVSAYVNTKNITGVTGTGIYMTLTDSAGKVWESNVLNYQTFEQVDDGWARISLNILAEQNGDHTLKIYADGVSGTFYLDDFYLEYRDVVTEYNLLENGFLQANVDFWTVGSNVSFVGSYMGANAEWPWSRCVKVTGTPLSTGVAFYQDVPINLPATETFTFSGWAKGNAVPTDPEDAATKMFGIIAEIHYSDNTTESHYAAFDPDVDEWQFAAGILVPKQPSKTISFIRFAVTYQGNANTCHFDSFSLVRQATQTMKYDDDGNLVSVLTKGLQEDTNTYSGGNLIQAVTSGNGNFTYNYDTTYKHRLSSVTNGTLTQSYGYDASGNVTSTTLSGGSGKTLNSSATYEGNNNRIHSITDSAGNSITYGYGAGNSAMWGLATSVTDGKNVTVTQAYDKFGRLTNTSLANTAALSYNYSNGNLTSVTRTNTPNSSQQTYTMAYDGFGNMTSINVGSKNLATYTYGTRNGHLASMQMANGETFTYAYDFLGRQTEQRNSSGTGLGTFYTADGQTAVNTEVGYEYPLSWRYTYDSLGRQIASVVSIPGGTFLQTQQSYNDKNQLTSKYWKMWAQVYGDSYTYNTDGSLNTMATASGANLQYHYDHLRRVSSITSNLWGTMDFYTKTYSYRDISATQTTTQVSSVAYTKLANPITFGYTYDAVGNVLTHSQTGEGTITYTYDNQGQLLKAAGDTTYTYTYDNVGNILTASNGTTTHTYTYGDANWKDLLTKFDGVSITYDAAGNPLAYYNGTNWTYTWAAGRRLMSAVSGSNTINFSYNEDGSRASKTVNGTRHNYTWDGTTLVRDYYGNTILDFSYDANGQPYAMYYNSTPYFYILNLQGDVIRMVDGNGNTVASYEYDPYGKVISATGTLADINPLRYRGYYYDQETKLYHLWSRYYDPQTGRFISADSYASTGQGTLGYNMFAYCNNCPAVFVDYLGMRAVINTRAWDNGGSLSVNHVPKKNGQQQEVIDITDRLNKAMLSNAEELYSVKKMYGGVAAAFYFIEQVKPDGDWDFKAQQDWGLVAGNTYIYDSEEFAFDDIGNIHYGFVGAVLFSEDILLMAGGAVQIYCGTSSWEYRHSYFDDPRDQSAIHYGFQLWRKYYG